MIRPVLEISDGTRLAIMESHVEYPRFTQENTPRLYSVIVNAGNVLFRSVGMASEEAHTLLALVQKGGVFDEKLNTITR